MCFKEMRVQLWVHWLRQLLQPGWTFGWHVVSWLLYENDAWHWWPCYFLSCRRFCTEQQVSYALELATLLLLNNTNIYLINEMPSYLHSRKTVVNDKWKPGRLSVRYNNRYRQFSNETFRCIDLNHTTRLKSSVGQHVLTSGNLSVSKQQKCNIISKWSR